jgi:enoyl-CoA hydratase
MTDTILVERRGALLLMGFNRPDKLNAFDPDMIARLAAAYTELARDRRLRCGVVWAEGKYFTSGLDLAAVAPVVMDPEGPPLIPEGCVDPWGVTTPPCPKPVVTAVQGRCFTLGIELMLCGQITVAAESASFTQSEVARGILPFGGGTVRWPLAVGTQNAYLHLLTADELDAAEAYRIGLVQKVVPDAQCLPEAVAVAERVARQAPLGVEATLRSVRLTQTDGPTAALAALPGELRALMASRDARRGLEAFLARRPAEFEGD